VVHTAQWIVLVVVVTVVRSSISARSGTVNAASAHGDETTTTKTTTTTTGWNPRGDHPCTVDTITMNEFRKKYPKGLPPLHPQPLIIRSSLSSSPHSSSSNNKKQTGRNARFRELTRHDTILDSFPANFTVTLSSSNSFSEHRRTIPLSQYLEEVTTGPPLDPSTLSNETWYLFGETYSPEWKSLLSAYEVPPCEACFDQSGDLVALSFGIGNSGSGVQWHVHGPGFSEAVHGRKHWLLVPFDRRPDFHPDQTSLNWMHRNYPRAREENRDDRNEHRPLECTLNPGDMVYFPDMWWHATINLDDYTAFVSTFTQEHLFVERRSGSSSKASSSSWM